MPVQHVNGYTKDDGTVVRAHTRDTHYAIGLPDRHKITEIPTVGPSRWTVAVQLHDAERAGKHFDLRIVDPATGIAHSWAIPKARFPASGEKVLAIRQPDHTADYVTFSGKILAGYGKGDVKSLFSSRTDILYAGPDKVRFNVYDGKRTEEFLLIRTDGNQWLLTNQTPQINSRIPLSKDSYKSVPLGEVDLYNQQQILQPKYDGAHVIVDSQPGKLIRTYSYRRSASGDLIEHTYRLRDSLGHAAPSGSKAAVLRAELIGVGKDGKFLPAHKVGGLLNSNIEKAVRDMRDGTRLVAVPFDVLSYDGKGVSRLPYAERFALLMGVKSGLPPSFMTPEVAATPASKAALIRAITEGSHPLTKEGLIVWDVDGVSPRKAKRVEDFDVYVRGVQAAMGADGKPLDRAAGFSYSWEPTGPIAGNVGSGFDHALLRDMLTNERAYVGRVAKVTSGEILAANTGKNALRSPVFKDWHLDKGKLPD